MRILIRGAGDLASGIAYELWLEGHEILMTDIAVPLAVRRAVSLSRAVYEGEAQVEEAKGVLVHNLGEARRAIEKGDIPVIVDERALIRKEYQPEVLVDAIMAKRNTGTTIMDAPLVVGVGPGFTAGADCHFVIETKRGPALGKVIRTGSARPNTGIPGEVGGYTAERLIRASADGRMEPVAGIGDRVEKGQIVAYTGKVPVFARMSGVVRGMLQKDAVVTKGLKIGDIDAREIEAYCYQISDKARCIGRGVCQAVAIAASENVRTDAWKCFEDDGRTM